MKKHILCVAFLISFCFNLRSQTPQFAVVRPNGTTQIYNSWASAYTGALDDDFIYLPGTPISSPITISKRLHIFGAGIHPDSSNATGQTIFTSNIYVVNNASGGSLEGVRVYGTVSLGGVNKIQNFTISNCDINNLQFASTNSDSLAEYITIKESIIKYVYSNFAAGAKNCSFLKDIITQQITSFQYCTFKNNIFLAYMSSPSNPPCFVISNSLFENNIFLDSNPTPGVNGNCYNTYNNNLKLNTSDFDDYCTAIQDGNLFVPNYSDIFIYYGNNGFQYNNNYHLEPTCPGVGAGTDGTDVGIYGTNNPTVEGWVPSNPHIYFKQVDPETGPDGKLNIQVGVRTNN